MLVFGCVWQHLINEHDDDDEKLDVFRVRLTAAWWLCRCCRWNTYNRLSRTYVTLCQMMLTIVWPHWWPMWMTPGYAAGCGHPARGAPFGRLFERIMTSKGGTTGWTRCHATANLTCTNLRPCCTGRRNTSPCRQFLCPKTDCIATRKRRTNGHKDCCASTGQVMPMASLRRPSYWENVAIYTHRVFRRLCRG